MAAKFLQFENGLEIHKTGRGFFAVDPDDRCPIFYNRDYEIVSYYCRLINKYLRDDFAKAIREHKHLVFVSQMFPNVFEKSDN